LASRGIRYPGQHPRRASVVGAGSFGTAIAVLLERAGLPTTLLCRTAEQARELADAHHNERYLPGVELPRDLRVQLFGAQDDTLARADLILLAVPSKGIGEAIQELRRFGVSSRAGIVSLAKGLVPTDGATPTALLTRPSARSALPAWAAPRTRARWASPGRVSCAARSEVLAHRVAEAFQRAGVVCEVSDDPVGVELAGVAKNARRSPSAPPRLRG
jgi:glycerol-3-phosphate dehydrogenase (NAD(P)+)